MKFLYFTFKVKRMFAMSFLPAEKCSVIVGSLLVFVSFVGFFFSSMCQQNGNSPFMAVKCERILD